MVTGLSFQKSFLHPQDNQYTSKCFYPHINYFPLEKSKKAHAFAHEVQERPNISFFHQINNGQLKQFYDYLNVKLVILQFGGNATPSIKDEKSSANYAGYLRSQIAIVKRAAPNASILFLSKSF